MTIKIDTDLEHRDLVRKLNKLFKNSPFSLEVGFFANATYPNGMPVSAVAKILNEGNRARGLPPRPFMSNAISENKKTWFKVLKRDLKKRHVRTSINKLGTHIQNDIKTSITNLRTPPNAPRTVARKGSTNPLIDTGHMRRSVTYNLKKVR